MVKAELNGLLEQELFLLYDGTRREWRRVLYFNDRGEGVEMLLTPSDPKKRDNWLEVERMIVRYHKTFGTYQNTAARNGDRLCRYIVRNKHSIVFAQLQKAMLAWLPFEVVNRLLYWDVLSQIDWEAYLANQRFGGCALALCKRQPKR